VEVPDTREVRLAGVRLILGNGAFVCGPTAAWIYGTDIQDRLDLVMWIGCQVTRRPRPRSGCTVRVLSIEDGDLRLMDGIAITTELRTVFDCGRWLPLVDAVVVADSLAHDRAFTTDELAAYIGARRGSRGIGQLDRVLDLMDPKSESPMETRLRLLIVLAGLPRPRSQVIIKDRGNHFVARADLGYPQIRYAIEYDGAFHWKQRRADDRRRDAMRKLGWEVLVVSSEDYYETPNNVVAKVRATLAERAADAQPRV
jgi:very-short-patch-repair endonuclease